MEVRGEGSGGKMVVMFVEFELAANSTHIVAIAASPTTPDTNTNNSSARLTAGGTSAAIHKDLFILLRVCYLVDCSEITLDGLLNFRGYWRLYHGITNATSLGLSNLRSCSCCLAHYNSKTMSRRPNSTRCLADSGGIPFMGSLHSKSRSSPLLSVGLLAVRICSNDLEGLQEWNATRLSLRTAVLPSRVIVSDIKECACGAPDTPYDVVVEADMKNSDKANAIRLLRFTMSSTKLIFG
ncbi:Uncharacterized protein Fot_11043 [Forsythia ovata]|uniref:Uncharacterized protein n=1 Tax=Forsythia ovata TaxID=205694 RepID=A0ABD1WLE9_9LAMI